LHVSRVVCNVSSSNIRWITPQRGCLMLFYFITIVTKLVFYGTNIITIMIIDTPSSTFANVFIVFRYYFLLHFYCNVRLIPFHDIYFLFKIEFVLILFFNLKFSFNQRRVLNRADLNHSLALYLTRKPFFVLRFFLN